MQKTASRLLTNYDIDWGVGWLTGQENNGQKLHAEGARSCFRTVLVFALPMTSTLQEERRDLTILLEQKPRQQYM
jgi:hypothetical protein